MTQKDLTTFPEPDQPPYYYLKIGEAAQVHEPLDDRWSLRFVKVISDARCPRGSDCSKAGPAVVQAQILDAGDDTRTADFITLEVGDSVRFPQDGGELYAPGFKPVDVKRQSPNSPSIDWVVTLRDLVPYPGAAGLRRSPEEYVGLFHIEWLDTPGGNRLTPTSD